MIRILTSSWTAAVCGVVLYLLTTAAVWKPPVVPPKSASFGGPRGLAHGSTGPSWQFTNPEADQLIAELKTEKSALKKRQQQLDDLALRLAAEQAEINQATQSVHQLQMEFDTNVVRVREEEKANLKKLAKVYSEMSPESAAKVFAQMDDQSLVKIMVFMKENEAAAVLEAIAKNGVSEAKRVADLSESLRLAAFRNTASKP